MLIWYIQEIFSLFFFSHVPVLFSSSPISYRILYFIIHKTLEN